MIWRQKFDRDIFNFTPKVLTAYPCLSMILLNLSISYMSTSQIKTGKYSRYLFSVAPFMTPGSLAQRKHPKVPRRLNPVQAPQGPEALKSIASTPGHQGAWGPAQHPDATRAWHQRKHPEAPGRSSPEQAPRGSKPWGMDARLIFQKGPRRVLAISMRRRSSFQKTVLFCLGESETNIHCILVAAVRWIRSFYKELYNF